MEGDESASLKDVEGVMSDTNLMMARELPPEEWSAFFDGFSQQHEGWLVTIKAAGFDFEGRAGACELPLMGIACGAKCDGEGVVSIFLGKGPGEYMTHTVVAPKHVRLKETEERAHELLEVESATGEVMRVLFRSTSLPEPFPPTPEPPEPLPEPPRAPTPLVPPIVTQADRRL